MEVASAYAGNISFARGYQQQLGVNLQSLYAKNHLNTCFLHLLAPFDIALFVKSCQEFNHHGNLLAITGGTDECVHHFGIFGKAVQCGMNMRNVATEGSLAQHTDERVERVIGHVDKTVFFTNGVKNAFGGFQVGLDDGWSGAVLQLFQSKVGKCHQVFVVLIPATTHDGVKLVDIQARHDFAQQILGHIRIIDDSYRFASFSALHSLCHFLQCAGIEVVVYFHLCVLGKLEGIRFKGTGAMPNEDKGETEADYIIQIHDAVAVVVGRYYHKTPIYLGRHAYQGVIHHRLLLVFNPLRAAHSQKDAIVSRGCADFLD